MKEDQDEPPTDLLLLDQCDAVLLRLFDLLGRQLAKRHIVPVCDKSNRVANQEPKRTRDEPELWQGPYVRVIRSFQTASGRSLQASW